MPVVKAPPQAAAVGRRAQPIRQTRSNPVRNSARIGGASGTNQISGGSVQHDDDAAKPHSFLPALTHFTDAIDALPKEVMRHFALLKEVDAKLFGPEKALMELTDIILSTMNSSASSPRGVAGPDADVLDVDHIRAPQPLEFVAGGERQVEPQVDNTSDVRHRRLFYQLRLALTEVLASLDEKNHAMATATQVLDRQLTRCDSIYPYLDHEISDEARYGSLTHWAYAEKGNARNNGVPNERSRRDGAGGNGHSGSATIMTEEAAAASRSESRREAMMARKNRLHPPDVGAGDSNAGRNRAGPAISTTIPTTASAANALKKGNNGNVKSRKSGEISSAHAGVVPEVVSSSVDSFPNKRRRTEKPAPSRVPAVSGGTNSPAPDSLDANTKGDTQSLRATAGLEVPKKRVRNGAGTAGNSRKRNVTAPSAVASPSLASSPLHGQFDSKDLPTKPQASAAGQRSGVGQTRRESVQSLPPDAGGNGRRRPSSSASSKVVQAHKPADSEHAMTTATGTMAMTTTKQTNSEFKSAPKMSAKHPHRESSIEVKAGRGNVEPKGGSTSTGRSKESVERPLKREDTESNVPSGSSNHPLPARRGSKPSKAPTPTASAVPEMLRSRSSRGAAAESSSKRLHKRGASTNVFSSSAPPSAAPLSLAGTTAKALPQPMNPSEDEEGEDRHRPSLPRDGGNEEEELESGVGASSSGGGGGTIEPRYCYCNQVSYGSMVACDADDCPREWFHLSCVGLTRAPGKNEVWYCNECKDRLHKGRPQPSGGNGSSGGGRSTSR